VKQRFLVSVLAATLGLAAQARADMAQETLAETLYQAGVDHIRAGDYASACPKLAESHKADPAGGTVLLLAICYEKLGKTASAWIKFKEALAMARADRRADREKKAREHLEELEPRLSRVTVAMPDEVRTLPGFTVEVDGTQVPTISKSWTMPVDRGEHRVDARATGRVPWSGRVTLESDGQREVVDVPLLEPLPDDPSPPTTPPKHATPPPSPAPVAKPPERDAQPTARPGRAQRTSAVVVGSVGLAAMGVGSYFGVRAIRKDDEARKLCPERSCSDPDGVALSDEAMAHGTRANGLLIAGGTVLATGVVLYLTAPSGTKRATWYVAPSRGGATLGASTRF
jgi:hypothetical protein